MKFSDFATDTRLEEEGVKVYWKGTAKQPDSETVWAQVARFGNPKFNEMYQRLMRPHRLAQQHGTLPVAEHDAILIECIAHTILVNWNGWQGDDGNVIPYSTEAAVDQLTKYREFRDQIVAIASKSEWYRRQTGESVAGE